jgi:hypothetical protein
MLKDLGIDGNINTFSLEGTVHSGRKRRRIPFIWICVQM